MDDAPGHYRWSAPTSDRVLEGGHGQARLHPGVDRIADDPTRAGVLERAQVDLALIGAMLGDIHQPLGVEGLSSEARRVGNEWRYAGSHEQCKKDVGESQG